MSAPFCGNNSNCFPEGIGSDCTQAMFTIQNRVSSRLMPENIKDSHKLGTMLFTSYFEWMWNLA